MSKIEYRVRPVTRYVISRYEEDGRGPGSETRGEYDNADVAYEVAYALCKLDHDRLGYPPGDERVQYPLHPNKIYKATGTYIPAGPIVPGADRFPVESHPGIVGAAA